MARTLGILNGRVVTPARSHLNAHTRNPDSGLRKTPEKRTRAQSETITCHHPHAKSQRSERYLVSYKTPLPPIGAKLPHGGRKLPRRGRGRARSFLALAAAVTTALAAADAGQTPP
jgi:hypothetical protein